MCAGGQLRSQDRLAHSPCSRDVQGRALMAPAPEAKGQSNLSCSSYRLIPFRHQHFGELAFLKAFLIFKDFFRSMFAREEDAYTWNN